MLSRQDNAVNYKGVLK